MDGRSSFDIFFFFFIFVFLLSSEAWALYPGDVNQDDTVNLEDGILALKNLSNFVPPSDSDKAADVSGDEKIGLAEAVYILRALSQNKPVQIQGLEPASGMPSTFLMISGTGFNPEGEVFVRFFDGTDYVVQVSAVEVSETSVAVSIPPFFSKEEGTLDLGTVSVQVVQKVDGVSTLSNDISGFEIQDLPVPVGSLTLSFLEAGADVGRRLLAEISGTEMDTAAFNNALTNQIAQIDEIVSDIRELIANPTQTVYLGTLSDTPVNVTVSDLKITDSILLSVLSSLGTDASMTTQLLSERVTAARLSAMVTSPCQQMESQAAAPVAMSGDSALDDLAKEVVYAPRLSANCKSVESFLTAEKIWAGAGAAAVGLLFIAGAPEIAIALPVAAMLYVSLESAMGMVAIGGGLGQDTPDAYTLVKEGVAKLETLMKIGPLKAVAPKAGAIAGIYYGARSLMEEFSKAPFPTPTTTSTTTSTTTTSTTSTSIPVSASGTYTGTFDGVLTETIDCAQWEHDVSTTLVITLAGDGTLIDPYNGSMSIEGTADSTGTYCNCEYGCDLGTGEHDISPFSETGEVSGSRGKVEAYTSGEVGTGMFDASFTEGTISGNALTGTLTFGSEGFDGPVVKTVTLMR